MTLKPLINDAKMWRIIVKCSRALFSSTKLSIHPEEVSSQSVPLITLNWVLKDCLHCPVLVLNGHSDETKNNLAFYISFYNAPILWNLYLAVNLSNWSGHPAIPSGWPLNTGLTVNYFLVAVELNVSH